MTIAEELQQAQTQLSQSQARVVALDQEVATLRNQTVLLSKDNQALTTEVATLRANADKLASAKALEITQAQGIPLATVTGKVKENPAGADPKPKTAAEAWNRQFQKG